MFTASTETASELTAAFEAGAGAAKLVPAPARVPAARPMTAVTLTIDLLRTFGRIHFPLRSVELLVSNGLDAGRTHR
ncbi:hypothetical protein O1Q96_22280 [Streptomyces sp. Qhu-G9]|uniref:hypothetical protein n=1 Tax=Streptomyces sp. Qhu-G9 TaxID=3452799 RepID=UPI0022ABE4E3|nr:hypothetical protein [Streptomyces aurantiacus]WAU82245.1 hypothetical protein O1Q96_22280 [Streptomyces aurantiacus]